MKTLVLGLGNELLTDDAVGVLTARALKDELMGQAEVIESSLHGLALLDLFIGYDRAIIVDAVKTSLSAPGTVLEFTPADLGPVLAPSPHYSGLPEMLAIAREMKLDFPQEIRIFALEVADPHTIGGAMSSAVTAGLEKLKERVREQLRLWSGKKGDA